MGNIFNWVASVLLLILFVATVGWLCGRLLGVRLRGWRSAVVGVLGWVAGLLAAALVIGNHGRLNVNNFGDAIVVIPVIIFFGVLAAMPISVVLDLITRRQGTVDRRRRRARVFHPVRTAKAALAPYGRLREVIGFARRQGLARRRYLSVAAFESPEFGRRLRLVLEDSGGMLVKFGQIASTRTDLLPEALTSELAELRADVRPIPTDEVRRVLEEELDEPVEQAFASFEWEPLGAASIGQTHRAVLHDGTRVVVKVQRPGIEEVVQRDAGMLRLAARQIDRRIEAARRFDIRGLTDELITGVQQELDYRREADAATRLRENLADDIGVAVPAIHRIFLTGRVLVMDEVVGRSVASSASLDASAVDRPELARRLLSSFFSQILRDGMYHADPHPGNIFIDESGTLWLLDLGAVGRLDPIALEGLQTLAVGFAMKDPNLLARAVRQLAGDPGMTDLRNLEADLGPLLVDAGGMDPKMVSQVIDVMDRHGLRPPAVISLLSRAMLTLEGTLSIIDPTFDLARTGQEVVAQDHREDFGTPEELLQRELLHSLPALRTLPDHAESLANQLRSGRMTIRAERYSGGDRRVVSDWIDRVTLALIGGIGAIPSSLIMLTASATKTKDLRQALWVLGFFGLTCSVVLLMRTVAQILRRLPLREDTS